MLLEGKYTFIFKCNEVLSDPIHRISQISSTLNHIIDIKYCCIYEVKNTTLKKVQDWDLTFILMLKSLWVMVGVP